MQHVLFAERLKEKRQKSGLSQGELADSVGISRSMIQLYEKGTGFPRRKTLTALASALGVSTGWLTGDFIENNHKVIMPSEEDLTYIPTADPYLTEEGGLQIDRAPIGRPFFRSWAEQRGDEQVLVLVKAPDNLMAPTIKEGDCALINTSKQTEISGGIYAVGFNKKAHLFRVFWEPGIMILTGDNKDIPRPFEWSVNLEQNKGSDAVNILGRAIWWEHNEWPLE